MAQNASSGANYWWTMSPARWDGSGWAVEFVISTSVGSLGSLNVNSTLGVRPVTSLKSCVTWKTGNGTTDSPYEVEISDECASLEN